MAPQLPIRRLLFASALGGAYFYGFSGYALGAVFFAVSLVLIGALPWTFTRNQETGQRQSPRADHGPAVPAFRRLRRSRFGRRVAWAWLAVWSGGMVGLAIWAFVTSQWVLAGAALVSLAFVESPRLLAALGFPNRFAPPP